MRTETISTVTTDWEDDWEAFEESFRLNPGQALRRAEIFRSLDKSRSINAALRILDVGSGTGDLAREIHEKFPAAEIAGLELSKSGIAISQKKVPSAKFEVCDLTQPQQPTVLRKWATHATCSEMLEHFDDPRAVLRNIHSYLAPGAILVVTVPGGPMSQFHKYIGHRRHYTASTLRADLDAAGFEVIEVRQPGFPFFNIHRLMVMARGKSLSKDISFKEQGFTQKLARWVLHVFRFLFLYNLNNVNAGWQLVATARLRSPSSDMESGRPGVNVREEPIQPTLATVPRPLELPTT